jgi:hypothetical protein
VFDLNTSSRTRTSSGPGWRTRARSRTRGRTRREIREAERVLVLEPERVGEESGFVLEREREREGEERVFVLEAERAGDTRITLCDTSTPGSRNTLGSRDRTTGRSTGT